MHCRCPWRRLGQKVFPDLTRSQAMEKLWEAILATSRVNGDPVAAWEEHNRDLKARCDYLNSLDIESLHYTADNGTDFTVGLMPEAQFCGGGGREHPGRLLQPQHTHGGVLYLPEAGPGRGIVYATQPLSYQGQLIEGFSIRFAGGKAVEVHAEKNEELLKTMISMDEGAAYLGRSAPWCPRAPHCPVRLSLLQHPV